MRRDIDSSKFKAGRFLTLLLTLLLAATFAGCAAAPKKPPHKKPATTHRPEPGAPSQKPPPEAARTNARPSTADTATPQRQASMRLVEKGKAFMDVQNYDRASAIFRDAINVDASNGLAYYHLAAADARTGQTEVALGLLDKAEALLGADAEWMDRINELRSELGSPASRPTVPSPIDQAF